MSTDVNIDIHTEAARVDVDVSCALSQPLPTEPATARAEAISLLELQKQLDQDISHYMGILSSNRVNMQTCLLDAQGFPLANKDLMAIRMARQRINILRNDSQALRDRMAKLLQLAINGDTLPSTVTVTETENGNSTLSNEVEDMKAFAKVNWVAENSPAQLAGLQPGDRILRFGSVTAQNSDGLSALAKPGILIDGSSIQLVIRRNEGLQSLSLTLVPSSNWGGRGLLGCHLLPL